jgi:hypothetical protein
MFFPHSLVRACLDVCKILFMICLSSPSTQPLHLPTTQYHGLRTARYGQVANVSCKLSNHPRAMPKPATVFIDLVSDSSESEDDCIILDSPPSPFRPQDELQNVSQDRLQYEPQHEPQDEPPTTALPTPILDSASSRFQWQSAPSTSDLPIPEAQPTTSHDEEGEEVQIASLNLQSVLVKRKKRVGRTVEKQFQHTSSWARSVDMDNPLFNFTVENFIPIWEFCVCRDKKDLDRTKLKKSFPRLDRRGLEIEFEKQVKEVIDLVSRIRGFGSICTV